MGEQKTLLFSVCLNCMEFRLAKKEDMLDIAYMICLCFNESIDSIKFYLDNKFALDRCTVCTIDGKIVSSLSMLATNIYINGKLEPANYIYAAATLPEHRNRGCMSKLLEFSCELASTRGEKYSALLPAKDDLYNYYVKIGYESFFKIKFLNISNEQMRNCVMENSKSNMNDSLKKKCDIYEIRNNICKGIDGSVIWDKQSVDYALRLNQYFDGSTVFSSDGYAVCFMDNENCVQVTEFMCKEDGIKNLLTAIYMQYPLMDYKFRVPVNMNILNLEGEVRQFGMIRKIKDGAHNLDGCKHPYLGLPLD